MKKAAIALSLFVASTSLAQEGEISFKATDVVAGIYMIEGVNSAGGFAGGNLGIMIGDDYVALVDDGLVPTAPTLLEFVGELTDRPVDFIINTHYHGDHTGANAIFADTGTVVFAHHAIRERLLENTASAGGAAGLPVVTFGEGVSFHLNGIEARTLHYPNAHTDGDSIIVAEDVNVIFAGDIQFNGRFPYIDLDGGGSVDGYIAAQQAIADMADEDTKIIPGHGALGSLADLQADTAMLIDGQARVRALVEQGMTEDEAVAANPLADYASDFDWYFINAERMTRTFYKDLTAE